MAVATQVSVGEERTMSFPPLTRGDQKQLEGWASMFRTAGRPDVPWRYNVSYAVDSDQHLIGEQGNCDATCEQYGKIYKELLAERDPEKRTALTNQMVQLVADTWTVVPIIEGMGYYAINKKKVGQFAAIPGRHGLGDVFERIPRPEQKPWK